MRAADWPQILARKINEAKARTFQWGVFDCCLFAAEVVLEMTGTDYAYDVRGYKTEEEAQAIIDGYGGLEAMVTALVGASPVHPSRAKRGDFVLGEVDGAEWIGICEGPRFVAPRVGFEGLMFYPMSLATQAWRIE